MQLALQRAEEIKKLKKNESTSNTKPLKGQDSMAIWQTQQNLDKLSLNSDEEEEESTPKHPMNRSFNPNQKPLTKDEIDVLRYGSFINGRNFVPFFTEIDSKEKFFFQIPFR